MFTEDELLPISALQHFVFCPRRAALVHIEGLWAENQFTVEGRHLHERAHEPGRSERRASVRVTRGLAVLSYRLGLVGKADVVEFHHDEASPHERIVVVEYKRGRPKPERDQEFRVQLCAQVLCLEDMLGRSVAEAAIYFGKARQRAAVALDAALRDATVLAVQELHVLVRSGRTPLPHYQRRKCARCSLFHLCLPKAPRPRVTAETYLRQVVAGDFEAAVSPDKRCPEP
jgi:CRISPR-associated exonuclease Cas4